MADSDSGCVSAVADDNARTTDDLSIPPFLDWTNDAPMTDNVIPFADPNRDPVLDKLRQAHEDEAARLGVEFTNFGWASDENGICSKTTKGCLVQQLRPLRQVYADLTEFAPIWEAFDKIEGTAS